MSTSDWRDSALCAQTDPEAFFPGKGESVRPAKSVCARCTVQDDCLTTALTHGDDLTGIWAGTTQRDRRHIRAERERRTA